MILYANDTGNAKINCRDDQMARLKKLISTFVTQTMLFCGHSLIFGDSGSSQLKVNLILPASL